MEFSAATKSSRHWAFRCRVRAALMSASVAPALRARSQRVEEIRGGAGRPLEQRVVPILDGQNPALELPLGHGVARLARPVDVEQRAPPA